MLIEKLGYEAPRPDEIAAASAAAPEVCPADVQGYLLPAAVLHADPLISYSGRRNDAVLGLASAAPTALRDRDAWFLVSPTWTIENRSAAERLRREAVRHRSRNPNHRIVFVCNTPEEVEIVRASGEAAFFFCKTATVPETIFRPLDDARRIYDAIYNARLEPWKRHELSLGIERCAFLYYRPDQSPQEANWQAAIFARHAAEAPGHVFINRLDRDGKPIRLSPVKVNRHLNTAAVGLCLSATEGAMFAAMEYMLAGLPIVSTPSVGGRHIYFDEDHCLTVAPDAAAVAEAVRALKARAIPPAHVNGQTLKKIERDRARFLGLLNAILEEHRRDGTFAMPWPFEKSVTMEWQPATQAIERASDGIVDGLRKEREKKGIFNWRRLMRRRHGKRPSHAGGRTA